MKVNANAKINLYLEVLRKRVDGYHEIETIFQEIDLHDELEFNFISKDKIEISVDGKYKTAEGKNNLIYKACEIIKQEFKIDKGVEVHLTKNIPFGAGLGGGSSDAAAVLKMICSFWEIKISSSHLNNLARQIGADVPFFLIGGRCVAQGIGDKLTSLCNKEKINLVLVYPDIKISTKDIYKQISFRLTNYDKKCSIFSILQFFDIKKNLFNRLEPLAVKIAPEIQQIKRTLLKLGADSSLMSGSGSSVFGIVSTFEKAEYIKQELIKINDKYSVWALTTL